MSITLDGTNGIDSPDLNITGTGAKITGDFSNATVANRVMFQTSTVNGNTLVAAVPKGTSVTADFEAANAENLTNASRVRMLINGTDARFDSGIYGSGSYLPMTFYAGGSEKLRILTSGGITFNGDTAAANALDDYEEGTWTPTLGGTAVYDLQQGRYTKIGRLVYVDAWLRPTSIGTGSTVTISGLPFNAPSINTGFQMGYYDGCASSIVSANGQVVGTTITILAKTAASNGSGTAAFFQNNTRIYFSCVYSL